MIICHVEFNNNISKNFYSDKSESEIVKKIFEFCERYGVETIEGRWSRTNDKKWNRDAAAGTMNGEKTYCPVNGWDCPYYKDGVCHIDDPQEDCDDWGSFWDSWAEWENA